MKIEITSKNLIITPAPKKDKKNGIKVWFWRDPQVELNATDLPIATTDIKKGKRKYPLPNAMRYAIKKIEF